MSERTLRPGNVAAAAVLVGGLLTVVQPRHVASIVQLTLAAVAVGAGLYALLVSVPTTWWSSPFEPAARRGREGERSDDLDGIRARLSGRRWPMDPGPPMPAGALLLLRPLIEAALERKGLGPGRDARPESARERLSPLTWAVLTSDPRRRPPWYRMRRPDPREVAEAVHAVLDDLDRLAAGGRAPGHDVDPHDPRPR